MAGTETAGQEFSVFDENTTDVIVPYGRGKQLITELCSERCRVDPAYRAALLKEANGFTVSLYSHQKKRLEQENAAVSGLRRLCLGSGGRLL